MLLFRLNTLPIQTDLTPIVLYHKQFTMQQPIGHTGPLQSYTSPDRYASIILDWSHQFNFGLEPSEDSTAAICSPTRNVGNKLLSRE